MANISLMKLIFLDSLSSLSAGKGFLQRQFRAVTSFHGEHRVSREINSLSLKLKSLKRLKAILIFRGVTADI